MNTLSLILVSPMVWFLGAWLGRQAYPKGKTKAESDNYAVGSAVIGLFAVAAMWGVAML